MFSQTHTVTKIPDMLNSVRYMQAIRLSLQENAQLQHIKKILFEKTVLLV